ncbi:hypothetical protein LOTGIDRAFT_233865 [Lottia gigantea]|uniref:MICOS complex subunit n=1 Tax=Lottia gigantea TaxID=225164 RepID=V4AAS6_LOTGI|nr:hypothetical protein LOTGIDRAFT_233865 [Lottia gigantea]ESO90391.1 hypothetical protein LOTGIDRAFT_233865 [Lottia gigantea]
MADKSTEENTIKIGELPIYSTPVTQVEYKFVPEEVGAFQQGVSEVRKSVWTYLESIQETTDTLKRKWNVSKAHTNEMIHYIQDDPAILPRVSVITVAGLGGIIAGSRGGILRKILFSGTAITAAAALCYPREAIALSNEVYDIGYNAVKPLWESAVDKSEEAVNKIKKSDGNNSSQKAQYSSRFISEMPSFS